MPIFSTAAWCQKIMGLGYRLYWHLPRLYNSGNFFGETENVFGAIISINMLCIPREASVEIAGKEIISPADSWKSASPHIG